MRRFVVPGIVLSACLLAANANLAEGDWPGFRGPDFDGVAPGFDAGISGLSVGWQRALGSGYSSVAVAGGMVVTMFSDGEQDVLAAFDSETGEERWRYAMGETYEGHSGSHDGPISTPVIGGGRVFGFGPRGHLFAVDAGSGEPVWERNVVEELEAKAPYYGFTSSPVLVDDTLVVEIGAPDGRAIAGFDPGSGELKWTAGEDGIDYQSPIAATVGGRLQIVAVGNTKILGIDPASGEVLWSFDHGGDESAMGGRTLVPLPTGEGRFFLMNRLDSSSMLQVKTGGDVAYEVEELWTTDAIKRSYVSPVYRDGFIYGINGRVLTCIDAATGERRWRSREPGDGFLTMAGDKLVVVTKAGGLHVADVSGDGYRELAHVDLFEDNSWSEAAIAEGSLFARSLGGLARVDVAGTVADRTEAPAWFEQTAFASFLASLESADDPASAIDAFMAQQPRFPILEGPDVVHFVYRGDATDVGIVGDMIGSRREDPMTRVEGADLFYYSMRLEPDAAVTYGFIEDFGEPAADPLNPNGADGLFGEVSWLAMPAWQGPAWKVEAKRSRRGRLETVEWEREVTEEVDGEEQTRTETRSAQVYLPAGYDGSGKTRYPTLYVHGGKGALEDGAMKTALDNLIGERIVPLIAVFVMPAEDDEEEELGRISDYETIVVDELVPLIDGRYPTRQDPALRGNVGQADFGAAAMVMTLHHPELFGRVGTQSAILFGLSIDEVATEAELPPLTIYMDWGTYDLRSPYEGWDMAEDNRQVWAFLREVGYRPAGGEVHQGFGWGCWQAKTDAMLAAIFPLVGGS